ncbi:hypothetical protein A4H97_19255 [Niastella yeongjuensis]|uniref:Uncharacterized protein n=1 Tax=Niastella yeongjuensis TaxID=354355 RepID=A0A1V9DYG8_9BACT|nr:hypothetical protein A4H97_19255 [Niastella yeongjuensis]
MFPLWYLCASSVASPATRQQRDCIEAEVRKKFLQYHHWKSNNYKAVHTLSTLVFSNRVVEIRVLRKIIYRCQHLHGNSRIAEAGTGITPRINDIAIKFIKSGERVQGFDSFICVLDKPNK